MSKLSEFHARLDRASQRLYEKLDGAAYPRGFMAHRGQPTVAVGYAEYTLSIHMMETEDLNDDQVYDLLVSKHIHTLTNALEALQAT